MEVIIQAKERQAAEANKHASILLQQLDLEKVRYLLKLFLLSNDFYSNMRKTKRLLLLENVLERRSKKKRNKH